MVFSSLLFLFYFLPIVLVIYFLTPKKHRNLVLFISSLFFYAWGEPVYVLTMLGSITVNFFLGLKLDTAENAEKKKKILTWDVVFNLALLVFFKYTNFFIETINIVLPWDIPLLGVTLPIGISFYTFQTMSYVIDVYRGKVRSQKNFINFGTYVALFPQLIAGPIVRYSTIDEQLSYRRETIEGFSAGIMRFTVGLAKKVLLADTIGMLWNTIHATAISDLSCLSAWLGIVAFAFQIYFDFSGYSDMAIGLGKMFGFTFEENFKYPYISKSVSEFWRRWHISLGTWFKEYVYIPLGGNRVSKSRMRLNLLIVWGLTGFWHGASFNFIAWGLYYGILLMIEKEFLLKRLSKLPKWIQTAYTFILVLIGWVLFSADNLWEAVRYLGAMFCIGGGGFVSANFIYDFSSNLILLAIGTFACLPYTATLGRKYVAKNPSNAMIPAAIGMILCIIYMVGSSYSPFLYFRF